MQFLGHKHKASTGKALTSGRAVPPPARPPFSIWLSAASPQLPKNSPNAEGSWATRICAPPLAVCATRRARAVSGRAGSPGNQVVAAELIV
jgi:hypothetical protein